MDAWFSARWRSQLEGVLILLALLVRSLSQVQMKLDLSHSVLYRGGNLLCRWIHVVNRVVHQGATR